MMPMIPLLALPASRSTASTPPGQMAALLLAAAIAPGVAALPLAAPAPPPIPCNPHSNPPETCPGGQPCPASSVCPAAAPSTDPALVTTAAGPLRGIAGERYRMWLGVPFAEPPLDELRWMPPRPKAPWQPDTYEAFDKRPNCAQSSMFGGWEPSSPDDPHGSVEDCLCAPLLLAHPAATSSCSARAPETAGT